MKKILLALVSSCLLAVSCGNSGPVTLPANTRFTTGYSADGYLVSSSSGKSFTWFPGNTVFTSTYKIKKGNELWTEYGKCARISMSSNGNIRIYDCSTRDLQFFLGGTWKPSK